VNDAVVSGQELVGGLRLAVGGNTHGRFANCQRPTADYSRATDTFACEYL